MKKTLALLVASTALTAAIGLPAWSAMHASESRDGGAFTALFEDGGNPLHLLRVSGGDDDHRRDVHRDKHHEEEDDDDDDDGPRGGQMNPAPAGTVAPPKNGLFGTGTPPKVQVN